VPAKWRKPGESPPPAELGDDTFGETSDGLVPASIERLVHVVVDTPSSWLADLGDLALEVCDRVGRAAMSPFVRLWRWMRGR
jgi:hypothetical protein